MSIIAKENSIKYEAVEPGIYRAVCCDVVDIGIQVVTFEGKSKEVHKIRIHWFLSELMKEGNHAGRPFSNVQRYTLSLDKKSNLRKDLNSWRGRNFTQEELAGFDLESIIGVCCQLNIVPGNLEVDPDNTDRWVGAVLPDVKGVDPLKIPNDYIRVKNRLDGQDAYGNFKDGKPPSKAPTLQKTPDGVEDDVPF